MKIRMPRTRACYPASRNEPHRLLCWIPREELEQLVAEGRVQAEVLEFYPSGLEVRLSRAGFDEFGLDLGVDPQRLYDAYEAMRKAGAVPKSGVVSGAHLERLAGASSKGLRDELTLPEPDWTDGEDARAVMEKL
jgi:hypothetical protein